jgi:hypothetical protein
MTAANSGEMALRKNKSPAVRRALEYFALKIAILKSRFEGVTFDRVDFRSPYFASLAI